MQLILRHLRNNMTALDQLHHNYCTTCVMRPLAMFWLGGGGGKERRKENACGCKDMKEELKQLVYETCSVMDPSSSIPEARRTADT